MQAGYFKFINPTTKKSILDFDERKQISVMGDFGGKSLFTNAVKTQGVCIIVSTFHKIFYNRKIGRKCLICKLL